MTIFNFISLFGGLALFLYGMQLMGDGLKKGSSGALKAAMEKVTNNPLVGFLLGLAVTAVIQSSTATIVLTSGLVGAGVLTLHQSIGIILGANVGTTITGQIIRLLDLNADGGAWLNLFKPSTLAPLAAIAGILFIMAIKTPHSDTVGSITMGFGILFTGLLNMTAAVSPLGESPAFAQMFSGLADAPIRWIVDDCAKFVEREIRRGKTYDAIIMDPPSYGRGPGGEVWKLEDNLFPFVKLCSQVLSDKPLFVIINSYTTGLAPSVLGYMLHLLVAEKYGGRVTWDELGLPVTETGLALPCGATGRWCSE